jgi:hypothetical protein
MEVQGLSLSATSSMDVQETSMEKKGKSQLPACDLTNTGKKFGL